MKNRTLFNLVTVALLWAANAPAYEVWMGTHLSTHTMAITPSAWSLTASKLEGVNINRAPHATDPATTADWQSMIARYTNAGTKMVEIARSEPTKNPALVDELAFPAIDAELAQKFQEANNYNYPIDYLMFYDNSSTYQGTTYPNNWTTTEAQHIRDWLDANGHANVKLMYDVRNNSAANQAWALNPIVDHVLIEASTTALLANTNNQITFLQWFWAHPTTANKRLFLQIPRTLDSITQYAGTRRVAQMLGGILGYGDTGMRSSRLVFLPVTYNDSYPYIPETASSALYKNTLTSICLSLLEQRDLFEGRLSTLPTVAKADSLVRTIPPTISAIADRVVAENTATPALPFTIGDADTPLASLTVTATSSNTVLVPNSGIVLGGSGANRTVTITPAAAAGQQGTTVITVQVNDGFWNGTTTFTVTVGNVLVSGATDASAKDDLTVTDQTSTTTLLGAGGSSPFVDRGTVYVFQLPNLGAVANPFKSSSFTFNYSTKEGTLKNNDLYGLGRRDSGTVLGSDCYGQSATSDPTDATRLQTSILTNGTPLGLVTTSSGGNTALLSYLNAQYASGVGIGKYVFLRLNTTAAKSGINRATLTMSEGGVASPTDTRPRISYTTNSAPMISDMADVSINRNTATAAIPFTVGDVETAAGSLTVTATSSNTTLAPNTGIVLGGSGANRTVKITPATGQAGVSLITLQVSDGTRTASTNFTLTVLSPNSVSGTLFSDLADSAPRKEDGLPPSIFASTATDATLFAGRSGSGATVDRCVVFPFQLPNLGATTTPFTSATITFNLVSNNFSTTTCNLDLYGLGNRDTPTVLASDYYSETNVADPTAGTTRLQDNLCNQATAAGLISTTAGGSALVNYLNAQYAGGANAGKYVFLRLSKDTATGASSKQFLVTSANGAAIFDAGAPDTTVWPQVGYTAESGNVPPTITDIADRSLTVKTNTGAIAFTIGDSQSAPTALSLSKSSSNPALVPTGSIVFGGSGANRTVTVTPAANQLGSATITVTVSDGALTASDTFVVTVTANAHETWRYTFFGTTANTGTAADSFDANGDGESNLMEFGTGQNPNAATTVATPLVRNGATLVFTYTRSLAAMADGVTFTVEWRDDFMAGTWSSAGVNEGPPIDNGPVQTVKATLPAGTTGKRFVHISISNS